MSNESKKQRTNVKGLLTRFNTYFDSIKDISVDEINFEELQMRLINAENLLETYNTAQSQIENDDPDYETNETAHFTERESFENKYYNVISKAKKFIVDNTKSLVEDLTTSTPRSIAATNNNYSSIAKVKLPTVSLPTFDGSYEQYLFFRDTFKSLIHSNDSLADVQKFHYLRLSLKGTAANIIKSLQISDANYAVAWKLLIYRYENKHMLVNSHVKGIFNIPAITKESHQGLRIILDTLEEHLRSLQVLELPTQYWDVLIIYIVVSKLDNTSRRDWEEKARKSDELPTQNDLTKFLKEKCRTLESLDVSKDEAKQHNFTKQGSYTNKSKSFVATANTNCTLCKREHLIYSCPEFRKLEPIDKLNEAKRLRLCINCLSPSHGTRECRLGGCRKCGKVHHTLLHFNNTYQKKADESQSSEPFNTTSATSQNNSTSSRHETSLQPSEAVSFAVNNISTNKSIVLLSTAVVQVFSHTGIPYESRILLDSGSQSNFISERLCQILQLPKQKINFSISGINQVTSKINYQVTITIKSKSNEFSRTLSCLVLPIITGNIPSTPLDQQTLNVPKHLILADPNFNKPAPIDMLIGADTFWELLCVGQFKLGQGYPILQKTKLGWLVSGPIFSKYHLNNETKCHLNTSCNIDNQLTKFWEIEECPKIKFLSQEDNDCENHFKQHTTINSDGRFVVFMPLKLPASNLGESKTMALNRFINIEKKLSKHPDLKIQYTKFMEEYENLKHMTLAENQNDTSGFFLPHHCVIKDSSTTTKLRVVYDGSAKTTSGSSLNDIMMVGPTLQDDLFSIILRFRKHNVVLGGDIAKMYRQVLIHKNQRCLQKILWRSESHEEIRVYELNTITYGLAASAFLTIRSLQEIAHRHADDFPKASQAILQDFYVDDLLTGGDTVEEVLLLKHEISNLLNRYGFSLRKFISNNKHIDTNDTGDDKINIGEQNKTLGLIWDSTKDTLQFTIKTLTRDHKVTKRQVLSSIAQIFDPLGVLAPVTITAKIILQKLWKLKLDWDESIPQDLHTIWVNYATQLESLRAIEIPRKILCSRPTSIELHGFSDASESAYGACIYIRYLDALGIHFANILCAKTRVAPLKYTTIPRLELCGASLLAELMNKVKTSINIDFEKTFYWSDSTIVLSWIHTCPSSLKVFVANRVAQIQAVSNPEHWHYVNTLENPADLLSRGVAAQELTHSDIWFHGPKWFSLPDNEWPSHFESIIQNPFDYSEHRSTTLFTVTGLEFYEFTTKFSSLNKLTRVFAYVLRFINNLKNPNSSRKTKTLQTEELTTALHMLISIVQRNDFANDYRCLKIKKKLSSNSKLINLNPFMDKDNLLRVGGRLENSKYNFDKKHPILLPSNAHLTKLIGEDEHLRLLHAGPQALLASLRERYWPLSGRSFSRKIVHKCLTCFKFNSKQERYLMGTYQRPE